MPHDLISYNIQALFLLIIILFNQNYYCVSVRKKNEELINSLNRDMSVPENTTINK